MTVQEAIFADVEATIRKALEGEGIGELSVVYDEWLLEEWPPEPQDVETKARGGVEVLIQPGIQEDNPIQITNFDAWLQQIAIGLTVYADNASDKEFPARAKKIKDAIIKALKRDRSRGKNADNTRKFQAKPWSWGDGTGCGFAISCEVAWKELIV